MTEMMFVRRLVYFPELLNPELGRYLDCSGMIPKLAATKYCCTSLTFQLCQRKNSIYSGIYEPKNFSELSL